MNVFFDYIYIKYLILTVFISLYCFFFCLHVDTPLFFFFSQRLGQSMNEINIQKCSVLLEERESWLDTCVKKGTMKIMLGLGKKQEDNGEKNETSDRPTKRQKK